MKITRLLERHSEFTDSNSLPKNFGDGFLLKQNRIFRNIRLHAIESGFKFTDQPWTDFQALPLSQLEHILSKKLIPYTDNVTILKKLAHDLKDELTWDDISDGYKRNFVFHESCHALARAEASRILNSKNSLSTVLDQQRMCLQILLEESFANTCELLAGVEAGDPTHKIFYEMSSYTTLFESRPFLKSAIAAFGYLPLMVFFMTAYLHSNFLKAQMSEKHFERTLRLAGINSKIDTKAIKNLKMLSKIPFTLDLRFRTVTTGLHLRLSRLNYPTHQLLEFDFLSAIESDSKILEFIHIIADKASR